MKNRRDKKQQLIKRGYKECPHCGAIFKPGASYHKYCCYTCKMRHEVDPFYDLESETEVGWDAHKYF